MEIRQLGNPDARRITRKTHTAVHMGFPRDKATTLVYHTMLGSTLYAMETGEHPAVLRNLVTSPSGTTASALYELENGRIRTVIKGMCTMRMKSRGVSTRSQSRLKHLLLSLVLQMPCGHVIADRSKWGIITPMSVRDARTCRNLVSLFHPMRMVTM